MLGIRASRKLELIYLSGKTQRAKSYSVLVLITHQKVLKKAGYCSLNHRVNIENESFVFFLFLISHSI